MFKKPRPVKVKTPPGLHNLNSLHTTQILELLHRAQMDDESRFVLSATVVRRKLKEDES